MFLYDKKNEKLFVKFTHGEEFELQEVHAELQELHSNKEKLEYVKKRTHGSELKIIGESK
jgi:hypothetical protein